MNPFRIITLVLLSLALAMMFYVVVILVPNQQAEYAQYQSTQQMNRFVAKNEAHQARMDQIVPQAQQDSVQVALEEAKAQQEERELALAEAEEKALIVAAQAQEAQAAQVTPAATPDVTVSDDGIASPMAATENEILGNVAFYDKNWASLMILPTEGRTLEKGLVIAVRRNQGIICEATIDGKDEPSGQYIAIIKANTMNEGKLEPEESDEVIISPFKSSDELMQDASPSSIPAPKKDGLQEIDAPLVPVF